MFGCIGVVGAACTLTGAAVHSIHQDNRELERSVWKNEVDFYRRKLDLSSSRDKRAFLERN